MRRRRRRYPIGLSVGKMHSTGKALRITVISLFVVIVCGALILIFKPFDNIKLTFKDKEKEKEIVVPTASPTEKPKETVTPDNTPTKSDEVENTGTDLVMDSYATIKYKSESARVMVLQQRLAELSYLHIEEFTEYYGPATKLAVSAFQRQHSLKVTGNANNKTLTLMFSADAQPYTLKQGDEGEDVIAFQDILQSLAYLDSKLTGFYGEKTVEAVKNFQSNNNLEVTGIADSKTIDKLHSPDAVPGASFSKKEERRTRILTFVDYAKQQLGKRYILGATGPNSFDCSGLVYYCLKKTGSGRGRLTAAGYSQVSSWEKITARNDLEIGDLLFFYSSSSHSRIGHVGIYVGSGMMIDASNSKHRIVKRPLDTEYWYKLFAYARRPW